MKLAPCLEVSEACLNTNFKRIEVKKDGIQECLKQIHDLLRNKQRFPILFALHFTMNLSIFSRGIKEVFYLFSEMSRELLV